MPIIFLRIWQYIANSSALRYILGCLVAAALLYGFHVWSFRQGEASKDAEYQVVIQEERARQAKAKREAEADAKERIDRLEAVIAQRNTELERLRNEASQDPNADRTSLGLDSVRRLNRAR